MNLSIRTIQRDGWWEAVAETESGSQHKAIDRTETGARNNLMVDLRHQYPEWALEQDAKRALVDGDEYIKEWAYNLGGTGILSSYLLSRWPVIKACLEKVSESK